MADKSDITVGYRREGDDVHVLTLGIPALPEIKIDYTGIPIEDRGGTAARLLAAAALYCFSSTVGAALKGRGAEIKVLEGTAVASKGKDEYYRTKVTDINISLQVEVDEKSAALIEKAEQIADRGCFITYSISEGIEVEHTVNAPVS